MFCSYLDCARKLIHSAEETETEDLDTLPVWRDYSLASLEMLLLQPRELKKKNHSVSLSKYNEDKLYSPWKIVLHFSSKKKVMLYIETHFY